MGGGPIEWIVGGIALVGTAIGIVWTLRITRGPDEPRGYPTLCKGRFEVDGMRDYAIEEPTSLNTLAILPELIRAGVRAIRIEGRQRRPG